MTPVEVRELTVAEFNAMAQYRHDYLKAVQAQQGGASA